MRGAKVIYGVQPVLEAIRAMKAIDRVYLARAGGGQTRRIREAANEARIPVAEVPREDLERYVGAANHQGVVALLDEAKKSEADPEIEDVLRMAEERGEEPLLVLLDGIQDPHNLGAIIRSAHALGAHGVVIPKHRAVQVTESVVRASAGAALLVPVVKVVNLKHAMERLAENGVWLAAAVLDGEPAHTTRLDGPLGLIVGGESKGVSPTIAERCELRISIPLAQGFDSLNASVAAGILLYEVARQRAVGGPEGRASGRRRRG
jgi:23S rRNA (guanosine2251-2'-O)-methyltransferase